MRHSIRFSHFLAAFPAILLALALTVPALAQTGHDHGGGASAATPPGGAGDAARTATQADMDKVFLLHLEYVAKTAELYGSIAAREAELEALLVTDPDNTQAVSRLTADIAALRGQLYQQATLFRLRYAKETGTPIHHTMAFALPDCAGRMAGHDGMMDDHGKGDGMKCGCMQDKGGMKGGHGMKGGCMSMGMGHDMMGGHDAGKDADRKAPAQGGGANPGGVPSPGGADHLQ